MPGDPVTRPPKQPSRMVRIFAGHRFQLRLSVVSFAVSLLLTVVAKPLGLLSSVEFVSWLSLLALDIGGLSGIAAALTYRDAKTGMNLNDADRAWIRSAIDGEVDEALEEQAKREEL